MIFLPKIIDDYNITRYEVDGIGRHYLVTLSDGSKRLFPSMTTMLSYRGDPEYIKAWKKRIGSAHAYAISKNATDSGTELHLFAEYIMLRQFDEAMNLYKTTKNRFSKNYMKKLMPYLKQYKKVYASEEFTFSLKYKVAGTLDACVSYEDGGIIHILDFKTSSTKKNPDSIENYYIQISGYALMLEEITGVVVDNGIILMVGPYGVQEIPVNLTEYKSKFVELVDGFYAKYGFEYQQKILNEME